MKIKQVTQIKQVTILENVKVYHDTSCENKNRLLPIRMNIMDLPTLRQ